MVDSTTGVGVGGTALESVLAVAQTNEILQTIQIILAIITFLVTIGYTVWKWYKNAKKDGKITKDEVEDLVDNIKDEVDKHD